MVVAQWWRPFGSSQLESVEVFVFVVQGKGKSKIVVPGSSFWCFTEKYYLPQAWFSIRAAAALDDICFQVTSRQCAAACSVAIVHFGVLGGILSFMTGVVATLAAALDKRAFYSRIASGDWFVRIRGCARFRVPLRGNSCCACLALLLSLRLHCSSCAEVSRG